MAMGTRMWPVLLLLLGLAPVVVHATVQAAGTTCRTSLLTSLHDTAAAADAAAAAPRRGKLSRHIVRFANYAPIGDLQRAITSALGAPTPGLWRFAGGGRAPAALAIPTDFAVVAVSASAGRQTALLAALSKAKGVKDVVIDSVLRSPLALTAPPTGARVGVPVGRSARGAGTNASSAALGAGRRLVRSAFRRSWSFAEPSDEEVAEAQQAAKAEDARSVEAEGGRRAAPAGGAARPGVGRKLAGLDDVAEGRRRSLRADRGGDGGGARRLSKGGRIDRVAGTVTSVEGKDLHALGMKGQGVKVAVFDTGLHEGHPHFTNVVERINWTEDRQLHDGIGHGTFVAGVICGSSPKCPGWAPEADLYVFRVFTNKQVSYTSWFLDSFNYAIWRGIDVLNLSIGGPDNGDRPFVEKINEMTASGIIVVSAIGNDGPLYGTLNNPADQFDTIGVGGVTSQGDMAKFSSRGMSTWELPFGYGRFKPDLTALGSSVIGSKVKGKGGDGDDGCRALSGTSVASPVVAGAVALLLSDMSLVSAGKALVAAGSGAPVLEAPVGGGLGGPGARRRKRHSIAAVKQALTESAVRFPSSNVFEQGAGRLNVTGAHALLAEYEPRASLLPPTLDMSRDCPYLWPHCSQPLYHTSGAAMANLTLLNGLGVAGAVTASSWAQDPWAPPPRGAASPPPEGELLEVRVEHQDVVWPWSGYLAVHVTVTALAAGYAGDVSGVLSLTVEATDEAGVTRRQVLLLPIRVAVIPTPPRNRRLLWDQFHSIGYPSGYFPRDNLKVSGDMLDWCGDHVHTNFKDAYASLRDEGYFVDVLTTDWTCVDAALYGAVLVVDSEDEFFPEEVEKMEADVRTKGLGLVVFADWFSQAAIKGAGFFDDNTRSQWHAVTGGANVPALNDLLAPFGVALGDRIFDGAWALSNGGAAGAPRGAAARPAVQVGFQSGVALARFPKGGYLRKARPGELKERDLPPPAGLRGGKGAGKNGKAAAPTKYLGSAVDPGSLDASHQRGLKAPPAVLGALEVCDTPTGCAGGGGGGGRVVVYGDASCLDAWAKSSPLCADLLHAMVGFAVGQGRAADVFGDGDRLAADFDAEAEDHASLAPGPESAGGKRPDPARPEGSELFKYSNVVGGPGVAAKVAGESCRWTDRMRRV